jgi:guanine deaminase
MEQPGVRLVTAGLLFLPVPGRRIQAVVRGGFLIDARGRIRTVGTAEELQQRYPAVPLQDFGPTSLILPGFVDLHTHLPQYQALGIDQGELLVWLQQLILPLEARFSDPDFAEQQAELFFRAALRCGTTTLVVFGPPYAEATRRAFRVAARLGLRVLMGQTLMDCHVPDTLRTPPEEAVHAVETLLAEWHGYDSGRLSYVVTPRFAGSCSRELLRLCAELATRHGLLLQTHLAESPGELRWIAQLFPEAADYTAVYEAVGMLRPQTLFAHAIYLSSSERERLRRAHCALVHCPRSNVFLRSGIMPLRQYLREGFRIGLGTDIGAGPSPFLLEEARWACEMAKLRAFLSPEEAPTELSPEEALWLATLGGAQALGLEHTIGSLEVGKDADFTVLDITALEPAQPLWSEPSHILARLLYTATPAAVRAVFVRGRELFRQHPSPQSGIS